MAHIPAERCLSIIQLLAEDAAEMPLGEIADKLALPKSGAHRLLATLIGQGWVEQDPQTSFYRLTMRLAVLGQRFYEATGIPDACQPLLDKLAEASHEFVRLAVIDEDTLVWVAHAQGAKHGLIYQPSLASNTVPLFATASGKSWLSTLGTDTALRIALKNQGFEKADLYGPNVIRSVDALIRELEATSQRGYGIAVNEAEPGVTALAYTVRSGREGPVVGTVSVAGPSLRMTDQRIRDLAPVLLATACDLSGIWPLRRLLDRKRSKQVQSQTEAA
jgi:IclR family transcriptional regulator, acetate operon repressor